MREPVVIQIADDEGVLQEYTFTPHPARQAVRLLNRLQNILTAPLITALAGTKKGKAGGNFLDRDLDASAVGAASSVLMRAIVDAGEDKLLTDILAHATTKRSDGKFYKCADGFDFIYTQNLGEMALAVKAALETTYKKSLSRILKGLPLFREGLTAIMAEMGISLPTTEQP